VIFSDAI